MSDPALLAVLDAVAWLRSALAGVEPAQDLRASLEELSPDDLEEVARDARVEASHALRELVALEHMRRRGKIRGWKFVASERGGPIRVDLLLLGPSKMIVLRA